MLSFYSNPSASADPATERTSQPSYGLHKDSFAILNKHWRHLSSLYFTTKDDEAYIEAIKQWKVNYLKENHCLTRLVGYSECSKNKAIKNAEPEDIKSYIKNNYILTGGKRKSLRTPGVGH